MIQNWRRDDGPCIGLGETGDFDDMHLFAPCVAYENGIYSMWYSGSQGTVAGRVFALGLATSTDGEVLVRGDTLLSGYLTGDGLSDPRDDEGWLATGDLGHLDASGRLFVSGRADRMFVSGGENVYPDEIERALLDHDSLTDAVVIAVPHAEYGERPVAFVATEGDTSGEDLARFLAEQLPGYKIPGAFFRLPPNTSAEALRRIGNDPDSFGSLRC